MKPLVLYGAGNNLETVWKALQNERVPVCLCDSDTKKHYQKKCRGGAELQILPLEEVLSIYPDAEFFITPILFLSEIQDNLLDNGVKPENIINMQCFPMPDKYKSCNALENMIVFQGEQIHFCCVTMDEGVYKARMPLYNLDVEDIWNSIESFRQHTIHNLTHNIKGSACVGCSRARDGYSDANKKISHINFVVGCICQLKCCYCDYPQCQQYIIKHEQQKVKRVLELFNLIKQRGLVDENARIDIANGELSINPLQDEILETFSEYYCRILTNAIKYSQSIEKVLSNGRINVSLDSGTRETYKLVKGIDCFDKVYYNIIRYASHGDIDLKYVLLPGMNDSKADIDGFLELAKQVSSTVVLSRDFRWKYFDDKDIKAVLNATSYFSQRVKELGLTVNVAPHFYAGSYKDKITEALAGLAETKQMLNELNFD